MKISTKIVALILSLMLALSGLSGCSKTGNCEECGQKEKLNEFVDSRGKTHWYCDDCYRMAKVFS